ncbi:MarR family winged helix-turn-helix transcriptional regulator [Vibrio olivae]|uniref:MarR family winged helix-turn-helix transcriptional regulator n=1 Tax=Vibrio olivae TaxID=1243002 RepID=A0ABV5HPI3_9VIBR
MTEKMHAERLSVSFFQALVLLAIGRFDECTAHDIVVVMRKDKAQITRLINELIALEMVTRTKSEKDRRQSLLHLTAAGQQYFQRLTDIRTQLNADMTQSLTAEQQRIMQEALTIMRDNLSPR